MYSLSLPLILPEERAFFLDNRFAIPPIFEGWSLTCTPHSDEFSQIIVISGLPDIETARELNRRVSMALRCASLHLDHGFQVSEAEPVIATIRFYDGQFPTIFETSLGAKPTQANAHVLMGQHLLVLAKELTRALASDEAERLTNNPELSAALKLYSEMEFAGGNTAKFVVLLSALEVLIKKSQGGKRGAVLKLVFEALQGVGRTDAKAVRAKVDELYKVRNALIHEARPVTAAQVRELSEIVRDTLRAIISGI